MGEKLIEKCFAKIKKRKVVPKMVDRMMYEANTVERIICGPNTYLDNIRAKNEVNSFPLSTFGILIEGTYYKHFLNVLKEQNELDRNDYRIDRRKILDNKHLILHKKFDIVELVNIDHTRLRAEDRCVCIPAELQPDPFSVTYRNKEELINEFKTFLSEYLPSDFPWKIYIGNITGSYIDD